MISKELLEKIARLEAELAEAKKDFDGKGVFKPEQNQKYWYISGVDIYDDWWNNLSTYESLYSMGNCFPSRESAECAVRVLKLIQKARESQDGFVPDWEKLTQNKFMVSPFFKIRRVAPPIDPPFGLQFACLDKSIICAASDPSWNQAPIFGYWENKSTCEQFIQDNHDELIWFFTEYRR